MHSKAGYKSESATSKNLEIKLFNKLLSFLKYIFIFQMWKVTYMIFMSLIIFYFLILNFQGVI